MQVGHTEQVSEILRYWFSGSQKKNTWLVETLQYVHSTFELDVVLFLLSWLLWWTDCIQYLFLHLILPNTYVAKAHPHCPSRPPRQEMSPPTLSSIDILV